MPVIAAICVGYFELFRLTHWRRWVLAIGCDFLFYRQFGWR